MAVLPGSSGRSCSSATSASPTVRIADIPASTGYGEPIQRFFKLKDGEWIVEAFASIRGVAGGSSARKEGAEPKVHAVAVSSDGYSLRFGFDGFVEPSTRGRRYAKAAGTAEFVGVARLTGGEIPIAATREAYGMLCKAEEVNFLGSGRGVILIKRRKTTGCSGSSPRRAIATSRP